MRFDARTFSKEFVKIKARRYIREFLDSIGEENLTYLIQRNKDITDYIPKDKIKRYEDYIRGYSWAADILSDEEVLDMLPDWAEELKEKHRDWFLRQIAILRGLIPREKVEANSDVFTCKCNRVLAIPAGAKEGMKIRCPYCKEVYILERR